MGESELPSAPFPPCPLDEVRVMPVLCCRRPAPPGPDASADAWRARVPLSGRLAVGTLARRRSDLRKSMVGNSLRKR